MSRHVVEEDAAAPPKPAGPRPLDVLDADRLGRQLGAGTLLILARDRRGRARAVVWALSADPAVLEHDEAHSLWRAVASVLTTLPSEPPQAPAPETQP